TDGLATSNTATVSITVKPVNDAPIAGNDTATTNEDTPVDIRVLANDTDIAPGTTLTPVVTAGPLHGTTTVNTDRTITYTPAANYAGPDSFTYTATDGLATSNTATVSITVTPSNAPTAGDDVITIPEDSGYEGNLLNNDTDPDSTTLTVTTPGTTTTDLGTLTVTTHGAVFFSPTPNASGSQTFTYTIPHGQSTDTATITVTVTPVNDAPTAVNDSAATAEDQSITLAVLANDTDIDPGTTLTPVVTTGPSHGTTIVNADRTITYTPNANYAGPDSFTYTATDGALNSNIATVNL